LRRVLSRKGKKFIIYAIAPPHGNPLVNQFIEEDLEEAERKKIVKSISRAADYGPPRNIEKSRPIAGESNLYEFKEDHVRVMYFYGGKGAIVLTHGFKKNTGPPLQNDIARAKRLRDQYLQYYGNT